MTSHTGTTEDPTGTTEPTGDTAGAGTAGLAGSDGTAGLDGTRASTETGAPEGSVVRIELTVDAPAGTAFDVFTTGMDTWWPRSHHLGAGPLAEVVVEPRVGGRLYGREDDGTPCPWGRVLAWDRPAHFAFSWDISLNWQHQPDHALTSRVDVTFTPVDDTHTTVTLVHSGLDQHGDGWETMRDSVASPGGWPMIHDDYARAAAAAA
ncbi:SRPBCC family protein [Nocardia sp. alder85J]|uniref:SRPBCC family protein n=1 Tax=Nocardia sp. alder85J TaxID=2862949 RepID=UPI001CD783FF|nr:SRPBCC family protein [Nocardia sp. alder85J]MCX4092876.1 SRPBCC family protein [Nocardia sp. alder85J]